MPETTPETSPKPHKKSHPFWRWYTLKKVMICSLDNNTKNAPRIAPYGTRSTKYEFSIILTPLLCNYVTSLVSMVRVIWYVYVAISCVQILHWDWYFCEHKIPKWKMEGLSLSLLTDRIVPVQSNMHKARSRTEVMFIVYV